MTNNALRFVFIDLEETIIDSWSSRLLINVEKIRRVIDPTDKLGVFSFAIWTDSDHREFKNNIRPTLERVLGNAIETTPTAQTMMQIDTELTGVRWESITDFLSIRGKVGAFTNFCSVLKFEHAVLIDDVVPNIRINNLDTDQIIDFINVGNLV